MTEDEKRFWDAAIVAIVGGIISDPNVENGTENGIVRAADGADMMLSERRKRMAKQTPEEPANLIPSELAKRIGELVATLDDGTRKLDWEEVVQVVLDELAKMPCELPTVNELLEMWFDEKDAGRGGWSGNAYRAERLIRARIAPILAAKDARIRELEWKAPPVNEVSNAEREQYEKTIELQKQRIDELSESNKKAWIERDNFYARATEDPTKAQMIKAEAERDVAKGDYASSMKVVELQKTKIAELDAAHSILLGTVETFNECALVDKRRIRELEKQLAGAGARLERSTPLMVNGKTPGDMFREVHEAHYSKSTHDAEGEDFARIYQESEDIAIQAVLSAFSQNAVEALSRFRNAFILRVCDAPGDAYSGVPHVERKAMYDIFDDELRKLGWSES